MTPNQHMVSNKFSTRGKVYRPPPSCISPPTKKRTPSSAYDYISTGGGKNAGLATVTITKSFAITSTGGGKNAGLTDVTITKSFAITSTGGGKNAGTSTITAIGKAYCQSTNIDTNCDPAAGTKYDLGNSLGTFGSAFVVASTSYVQRTCWDFLWTPKDGPITISLNCTDLQGTSATWRFRAQALNSACTVIANSAYSAEFTTTGIKTMTDSLTGTSGANRLRISLEAKRSGGGPPPPLSTITDDANSYITYQI
jgi:hypothetical protein